jgi:S-adenosylmethionine hydrolase
VRVDRFGNAVTNLTPAHGSGPLLAAGRAVERGRVYEDVPAGSPVALEGSSGFLEIALNLASASAALGLAVGDVVRLAAAEPIAAGSPAVGA